EIETKNDQRCIRIIELPSETQNPRRRHSPSSPRVNLRSPAVVFSVIDSRGEGSIENHEDPHLGNGPVDSTLAVRVFWRRRGDVAAATTTVEPPSEDRTSKARTTAVLPRSPVLGVLPRSPVFRPFTPSHPLFNFNHRSPLTEFDAAQHFVPASLLHHRHREAMYSKSAYNCAMYVLKVAVSGGRGKPSRTVDKDEGLGKPAIAFAVREQLYEIAIQSVVSAR
ncbi:hypothetical protein PIB30_080731, partial [Stylosanthes scabra]|nr:hypothetical protein [Stylosanthes scabra]